MRALRAIFDFYINSSIHVALAVCALSWVTVLKFGVPLRWNTLAFIFFATITGYNFVKYAGIAKLHYQSLTRNLRIIQLFSLVSFLLLVYTITLQSGAFLWVNIGLGLITFFYAVPFLPKDNTLRSLRTLKIFVIAFVWAGTSVLLPLVDFQSVFSAEVIRCFFQNFMFVLAITLPFEIRDLGFDSPELGTFPQRLGLRATKLLGYALLIAFLVLGFFSKNFFWPGFLSAVGIVVAATLFIFYASKHQPRYYASFWVEALPIVWFFVRWSIEELSQRSL